MADIDPAVKALAPNPRCRLHTPPTEPDIDPAVKRLRDALDARDAEIERLRKALEEIADWDAHTEGCAEDPTVPCSCGWSEVEDFAREATASARPRCWS